MELDLKAIRCFVMLAEELNFSRAAARLNITQPAFSSQIRVLEQRLGLLLFQRTTRQVTVTDAARTLLPTAQAMITASRNLEGVVETLIDGPKRRLVFGAAFYTIDIPERIRLLETFFQEHQAAAITVSPAWQNELVRDLQNGVVDLGLLVGLPVSRDQFAREIACDPAVEIVFPDDLPRILLRSERVGLLVPRESVLSGHASIPRDALRGQRVAVLGAVHGQAVVDPISRVLETSGALAIVPPESHAIGVERYGRQFRIPAVSLGWFQTSGSGDDMIRLPIDNFFHTTELVVVRRPGALKGDAATLWKHVADLYEQTVS